MSIFNSGLGDLESRVSALEQLIGDSGLVGTPPEVRYTYKKVDESSAGGTVSFNISSQVGDTILVFTTSVSGSYIPRVSSVTSGFACAQDFYTSDQRYREGKCYVKIATRTSETVSVNYGTSPSIATVVTSVVVLKGSYDIEIKKTCATTINSSFTYDKPVKGYWFFYGSLVSIAGNNLEELVTNGYSGSEKRIYLSFEKDSLLYSTSGKTSPSGFLLGVCIFPTEDIASEFPVGTCMVSDVDPSTILGYGTWTKQSSGSSSASSGSNITLTSKTTGVSTASGTTWGSGYSIWKRTE